MKWFKKSLIRRIGLVLSAFVIGATLLYGLFSVQMLYAFFAANSESALLKDARLIATEIDSTFEKNSVIVEQMKTNQDFLQVLAEIKSQSEKRTHPLFFRVTQSLQAIKASDANLNLAFVAISTANDLITSDAAFDSAPGYQMSERNWYKETIAAGQTTITKPYLDLVTQELVVSITTPISTDKQTLGALGIDVRVSDIYQLMNSHQIGSNGQTLLINKNGGIFYRPEQAPDAKITAANLDSSLNDFGNAIFSGNSGVVNVANKGNPFYLAYVPTEKSNWIVATVIPRSEVLAPLYQFIGINGLLFLLLVVIIGLFIRSLTSLISKPLVTIAAAIESFSRDDTPINLPAGFYARDDEIGVLANCLHQTSRRILDNIAAIEHHNTTLNQEIKNRKAIQSQLEKSLALLAGTEEGVFILDQNFSCIYHNAACPQIVGLSDAALVNINLRESHLLVDENVIAQLASHERFSGEVSHTPGGASALTLFLKISQVMTAEGCYYIGSVSDLTLKKQIEKKLNDLKYVDPLTGLHNRLFLDQEGTALIAADKSQTASHALILINIADFRIINEAHGFDFGNAIIIELAERLSKCVSDQDFLARLNNDEFGIFKTHLQSPEQLYLETLALSKDLSADLFINNQSFIIETNIGISLYPSDASSYLRLFKTATTALNNVIEDQFSSLAFYNQHINNLSLHKYEIQQQLRNALVNNEFRLYYQPQFDIRDHRIVGIEALIRWFSPRGMIPPDHFIAIAEESNLILPIGEWVLLSAGHFGKRLYDLGHPIPIAINLTKLQFKLPYIKDIITAMLAQTGLPAELLELEITERTLMDNEKECEEVLSTFNKAKIPVAIDDFGTGYSSLSYLKKFTVDKIKIDRAFIKDIPDHDDGAIAKVIIELAENFNLQVIAEGVETTEQIAFLKKNQCHLAQGYYYAKPLSEEELLVFLKTAKIGTAATSPLPKIE